MRVIFIFLITFLSVLAENRRTNYLTESMGQEVIEIGAPIKDLPPDLEEEPSAENDDDKASSTPTTLQVATQKDVTKVLRDNDTGNVKDADKLDTRKDDDEARIEKELADIYKDSVDYKADSGEVMKEVTHVTESAEAGDKTHQNSTEAGEKPILRARHNFKFQPDSNNPREIARFRTSVDEISCRKSKLSSVTKQPSSGCGSLTSTLGFYVYIVFKGLSLFNI